MAKLYNHKVLGASCIVSEERLKRPYITGTEKKKCPFCQENTHLLEKVYDEVYFEDEGIRIVNNKYPVCGEHLEGIHDVVIDTLHHHKVPREYTIEHWIQLIAIIQKRYTQLRSEGMQLIQIFKNSGDKAGASIMHQHWQIIALREIPLSMQNHYDRMQTEIEEGNCPLCNEAEETIQYCISTEGNWKLVIPRIPSVIRETWIIPTKHISTIEEWSEEDFRQVAILLQKILNGYYKLLGGVDYNICFMMGKAGLTKDYHCCIKILPRTGNFAGFELATGCMVHVLSTQTFYSELTNIL